MEPLLEKDLEQAARRQGVTKSQFIIEAVERALGRRNPGALYLKVMQESAQHKVSETMPDNELPLHKAALRQELRAKHAASVNDWLAYQDAKKQGVAWVPGQPRPAA
jgi:RHH-type rel operon transcriptional repressor/antitoxin RelB